jgi:hypothetical protein
MGCSPRSTGPPGRSRVRSPSVTDSGAWA